DSLLGPGWLRAVVEAAGGGNLPLSRDPAPGTNPPVARTTRNSGVCPDGSRPGPPRASPHRNGARAMIRRHHDVRGPLIDALAQSPMIQFLGKNEAGRRALRAMLENGQLHHYPKDHPIITQGE